VSDLDLKPLAQAIDAVLPPGVEFVLIVRQPGEPGRRHAQMISALEAGQSWRLMNDFVNAARDNQFFNPKVVSEIKKRE
jgi:hypothetical protein